jgi:hypothetical protein
MWQAHEKANRLPIVKSTFLQPKECPVLEVLCRLALAEFNSTAYVADLLGALCSRITASHHLSRALFSCST